MKHKPQGKELAILGYASAIFLFLNILVCIAIYGVAVILNWDKNQPFAIFHLRQMAGILAISILVNAFADALPIGFIPFMMTLFLVLLAVLGLVSALRNQKDELPFIGSYFQKWFNFIK